MMLNPNHATVSATRRGGFFDRDRSVSAFLSAPAGIFLAVCFFLPLAGLAWISVSGGFGKYMEFFSQPTNLSVLRWTITLAAIVTVLCVALAYPVAYWIHKGSKSISGLLYLAVLLPYFTSYLVRTYAWMVLLGRQGPINQLIMALGISDEPLKILYSSSGVVIAMVYILIPYCVLVMASTMGSIPDQLTRAANSLGASRTQSFFRIFLPLSAPGVAAGGLLTFVFALGFYITPTLVGGGSDMTVPMLIDTQLNTSIDWPAGAASAVVLLVVTIVLYTAANRLVGMEYLLSHRAASKAPSDQKRKGAHGRRLAHAYITVVDGVATMVRRIAGGKSTDSGVARPQGSIGWFAPSMGTLVVLFLLSPLLIIVPISLSSSSFLSFPPPGISLRWYETVLGDGDWLSAIGQSIKIASLSAIFSVTVGTGAALSIVKMASRTRALTLQFLLAPLIVPSIVGSVALYFLFAKLHLVGTLTALVLAHSVAAVPVVVLVVAAGLQGVDPRLERAAASLGAAPLTTLRVVTLPLVARSLFVAGFVAFLHSFDEVVYALFLSGPRLVTLPIRMWSGIRDEISPAIAAVSTLLILFIVLVYGVSEFLRQRQQRRRELQSFSHAQA